MDHLQLSRRNFVKGAAGLAVATGLAACGDVEGEDATTTGADASSAGTVVIGRPVDSDNLDPVTCLGNVNIFMFNLIVEGLVKTSDTTTEIEPCLAESWDVSDDGKTYTFHVMEGLKFSDGSDVTAEDWKWTFERAMAATDSNWYSCVENIESVECPDDTTVIVTTKEAAASTLANLSIFEVGVQSKEHFDEVGEEEYVNAGPIGTGPYVLDEWSKGEYMTFKANPNYREEGLPLPEEAAGGERLPHTLGEAVDRFESSELMREVLGDHIFDYLVREKRAEWYEYCTAVTDWEREHYYGGF